MNNLRAAHCRLCAEFKAYNLLVDLQADEYQKTKIMDQLSRLRLRAINLDSADDLLPKTVCPLCIDLLDEAYSFSENVVKAQNILNEYVLSHNIKKEIIDVKVKGYCNSPTTSSAFDEIEGNSNVNDFETDSKTFGIENGLENDLKKRSDVKEFENDPLICNNKEYNSDVNSNNNKIIGDNISGCYSKVELETDIKTVHVNKELQISVLKSEKISLGPEIVSCDANIIKQKINQPNNKTCKNLNDLKSKLIAKQKIKNSKRKGILNKIKTKNLNIKIVKQEEEQEMSDNVPLSGLQLSWNAYSWKCALCDLTFPHIDELISHSKQLHSRCNAYECTECKYKFFSLDNFVSHIGDHKNYLRLSCVKCHMRLPEPTDIHLHYKTHLKWEFKCMGCHETFQTPEELLQHKGTYNRSYDLLSPDLSKLADGLFCKICERVYCDRQSLKRHMLHVHSAEKKKEYFCDTCGKSFLSKCYLTDHMKIHNDIKPFQCKICYKTFRTCSRLSYHVAIHDGKKPFSCDICGNQFRLLSLLKLHKRIHTNKKPWVCDFCNKAFKSNVYLNVHIRIHTGEKPYSCQPCNTRYVNWTTYNQHMVALHGQDKSKKKITPNGTFPVDPNTGNIVADLNPKTLEWKKKILAHNKSNKLLDNT